MRNIIFMFLILMSITSVVSAENFKFNINDIKITKYRENETRNFLNISLKDSWFGRDKMHHFITSAFLSTAGYYYCREGGNWSNSKAIQGGVSISLSIGILKEIRDGRKPGNLFSVKDLMADILGTIVGIVIIRD